MTRSDTVAWLLLLSFALPACVLDKDLGDTPPGGTSTSALATQTGATDPTSSSTDATSPTTGGETTGAPSTTGEATCMAVAPDFMVPPSSTRDEALVMTVGPGPRFEVPAKWLTWHAEHANNMHLSRPELEAVREGAGDWDTEYAQVLASVLDFDRCSAHVGGEGWGGGAVSYGDLQLRVYVLDELPTDVLERLDSTLMGGIVKDITLEMGEPWTRALLHWDNWYGDYGGAAFLDLRLRRFETATVVLAGMYADGPESLEAQLDAIVASTCWSPGTGECCSLDE